MSVPIRSLLCSESARYRWHVVSRVLAAAVGGYALAALFTAALALLLPRISDASRAESVLTATLWSFAIYAVVLMWVFTPRSATRAWLGLAASAAVLGVLLLILKRVA
ncbi:DUF3649 domain-containing protein [Variovorax sp. LT1R16]|uniref:DUF3649 domain-containing protein n=1 Tax=Variovorax sp. LT1R16 TaxID=3443728 RepID=UPI003F45A021